MYPKGQSLTLLLRGQALSFYQAYSFNKQMLVRKSNFLFSLSCSHSFLLDNLSVSFAHGYVPDFVADSLHLCCILEIVNHIIDVMIHPE